MCSTALIFSVCCLPALHWVKQQWGSPSAFSLLCSGLTSNGKITEKEERGKTKQNKIKRKNKILSFSSPHLCSMSFSLYLPPHLSLICFPLLCLRSQLGEEDRNNWKSGKHKEGKTEGASGQPEAFSGIPSVVKLFLCQYHQFRWITKHFCSCVLTPQRFVPCFMFLLDSMTLFRRKHGQMLAHLCLQPTHKPAKYHFC